MRRSLFRHTTCLMPIQISVRTSPNAISKTVKAIPFSNISCLASAITSGISAAVAEIQGVAAPAGREDLPWDAPGGGLFKHPADRQSVVTGKSVSLRVALGGRRTITKKTQSP